jgi:glycosyltransferase involved in cell wall biosynthesis
MILNAVMCILNEEDIIESTVKHAFAQGCSNVFIVDNASTDRTVEIATNAGAILANSFESKYFNEFEKIAHLNTVVRNYNEQSDEEHIWWLYIDADEFPNVDCELRIVDFLKLLDTTVRAVHGYMFDHLPTHFPYNIPGYHPVDFMQLAKKTNTHKIPLLRYDKNKPHLYSTGGAHSFDTCGECIHFASDALNIHHFNFRNQENTLRRLKQLTMQNSVGVSRINWFDRREKRRKKSLDAKSMYHNRYERAKSIYYENEYKIFFTDELQYSYNNIVRWYNPYDLKTGSDTLISHGIHNYFLKNYDIALFKFNDLLNTSKDYKIQMLSTIKISLCLYVTDKKEALFILQPILKCPDTEIRNYAIGTFKKISDEEVSVTTESKKNGFIIQHHYGQFANKNPV